MSSLKEYAARVFDWERKYGDKRGGHRKLDLAKAKLRKSCAKCNKLRKRMHRHHKGHEYLFACLNEDEYAPRYIEFNPEDTVILCGRCHKTIHRKYELTLSDLKVQVVIWREENECQAGEPVPKEILEPFRLRLIEICNKWLDRRSPFRGLKRTSASGAERKSGRGQKSVTG